MKIDNFIETFVNGDFFIVFLAMMFVILLVLIVALIKLREENKQLLGVSEPEDSIFETDNPLDELLATSKDDVIDEDKPLFLWYLFVNIFPKELLINMAIFSSFGFI